MGEDIKTELIGAEGTETTDLQGTGYLACPICGGEAIRLQREFSAGSCLMPQPTRVFAVGCRYRGCIYTLTSTSREEVEEIWQKVGGEKWLSIASTSRG